VESNDCHRSGHNNTHCRQSCAVIPGLRVVSLSAVMLSEGFQWRQTPLVGIMRSGRIPSECVSSWFLCETTDLNHTTTCCSVCSQDFGFRYGGGDACYCCRRPVDPQIGYIAAVVFGAHGRSDLAKQLIQELHSSCCNSFRRKTAAKVWVQRTRLSGSQSLTPRIFSRSHGRGVCSIRQVPRRLR